MTKLTSLAIVLRIGQIRPDTEQESRKMSAKPKPKNLENWYLLQCGGKRS